MQGASDIIGSLQHVQEAVVRVGALLVIRHNGMVLVHQLTVAQQQVLNSDPGLLTARQFLDALQLTAAPAVPLDYVEAHKPPGEHPPAISG